MSIQTPVSHTKPINIVSVASPLRQYSEIAIRYAMIVTFLWFGTLKFTAYEANAISGLAINSPVLAWLHEFMGTRAFSNTIGIVEITTAVLLAAHPYSPRLGALGGLIASSTFVVTLSFMFTTPGIVEANSGGFPLISVMPGQFLVKDLVLLAVSVWLMAGGIEDSETFD